jgi:hypothetical protein
MKDNFVKKSECYNRAQTWTYDANRKFGYEAKKILIHYSLKYNQELSSKWGFHIAPVYQTEGTDMVYDKGFQPWIHAPVTKRMWEEKFLAAGTQELVKRRIKLTDRIKKLQASNANLDRNDEFAVTTLIANNKKIAEYKAELVEFKITDQELKEQRPEKIKRVEHWIEYYKSEIEKYENRNPKLTKGLKTKLNSQLWLLSKVKTDLNYAAHIQCEKITNIQQLDFNLNGAWCYIQEVNQYYWGIPQLRQLNYGVDRIRDIPSRDNLVEAYREGEKYQRFDFEMNQVWAARKQAFGPSYETLWSEEYNLKEDSREAVADIWDLSKDAASNIKKANKLYSKIVKASKNLAPLRMRVLAAKKSVSDVEERSSIINKKKDEIYAISNSILVADTKKKVEAFAFAKSVKSQSDSEISFLTAELKRIKTKAKEIQRRLKEEERERRRNSRD